MSEEPIRAPRRVQLGEHARRLRWRAMAFLGGAILLGAIAGLIWAKTAPLPSYTVLENYTATMSERQQASLVAADVLFALLVALLGASIGFLGWVWFSRSGVLVLLVPLVAAIVAAVVAWQLGEAVGPSDFTQRLAAAEPGAAVQVDLQLRAISALLVAPFAAITPIMLVSAFSPEGEEPTAEPASGKAAA